MADYRIERLARVILEHSIAIREGESVSIHGTAEAEPLLLELYAGALDAGALPYLRVSLPRAQEIFYAHASDSILGRLPEVDLFESEHVTANLTIMSESNTRTLAGADPGKLARVKTARKKLKDARHRQRWNVAPFPTPAYAQDAGMPTGMFEDFVFGACLCGEEDPVAAWASFRNELRARAASIDRPSVVHLEGEGTDLELRIDGRKTCVSCGEVNLPDGEIYMGPVETGVDGVISFTYPAIMEGREVEGVRFRFEKGRVVEATAKKNGDLLDRMFSIDEGARSAGELGIGCNYRIDRFTRNLIFDEKIGGTVHLGMGESYPETEGRNHSAIHMDFVCDIRRGGKVTVDGREFMKDGEFV